MDKMERVQRGFAQRLFELRSAKGVSAREMSLSLGQSSGYVSNLENGRNLPSMAQFFAICSYLGIMPERFFAFVDSEGGDMAELCSLARKLESDDLGLLLEIARRMGRKDK